MTDQKQLPTLDGMNHGRLEVQIQGWDSVAAPRFLAVFHTWHVRSKGFEVVELSARERKAAEQEAALLWRERQGFYSVEFALVELDARERVRRKLTWRERLTGWLCEEVRHEVAT